MAWNPSSNTLTRGFTKIAANGQGDLQKALNRSVMNQLQLVCDIDGNGNRVNAINPAARYKPFCYDGAFATEAAREAKRVLRNCGLTMQSFNSLADVWSAGLAVNPNQFGWAYEPPRANQATEPKRANDFINEDSDSRGYCSTSQFAFDYKLFPNPMYRGTSSPKIQLPTDVMYTNDMIDLSDLQGDNTPGYTLNHGYYNIAGYYLTVAIAEHGTQGPSWVKSYATLNPAPTCDFFDNLPSPNTSKTYDVIFFWFKPSSGSTLYDGGSSSLNGSHILAPYPYLLYQYVVPALNLNIGGTMSSNKKSVTVTVSTRDGATVAFTQVYMLLYDGGELVDTVRLFVSRDSPFTSTTKSTTKIFDYAIPDTTTFVMRVYSDSTTYLEQGFDVMRPI